MGKKTRKCFENAVGGSRSAFRPPGDLLDDADDKLLLKLGARDGVDSPKQERGA